VDNDSEGNALSNNKLHELDKNCQAFKAGILRIGFIGVVVVARDW